MQWRDVSSTQIKKTISIWISSYLKQFENSVQWINTAKLLIEKSRIAALFFQKKSYITHYMISWPPWASRITNLPIITPWSYYHLQPYTLLPPPSALHLTTLPPHASGITTFSPTNRLNIHYPRPFISIGFGCRSTVGQHILLAQKVKAILLVTELNTLKKNILFFNCSVFVHIWAGACKAKNRF